MVSVWTQYVLWSWLNTCWNFAFRENIYIHNDPDEQWCRFMVGNWIDYEKGEYIKAQKHKQIQWLFFFKLRDKGYVILLGFTNVVHMIEKENLHQCSVQGFFFNSDDQQTNWNSLDLFAFKCILDDVIHSQKIFANIFIYLISMKKIWNFACKY